MNRGVPPRLCEPVSGKGWIQKCSHFQLNSLFKSNGKTARWQPPIFVSSLLNSQNGFTPLFRSSSMAKYMQEISRLQIVYWRHLWQVTINFHPFSTAFLSVPTNPMSHSANLSSHCRQAIHPIQRAAPLTVRVLCNTQISLTTLRATKNSSSRAQCHITQTRKLAAISVSIPDISLHLNKNWYV